MIQFKQVKHFGKQVYKSAYATPLLMGKCENKIMNAYVQHQVDPVVRTNLDFRLNEVPRFWFDNDPFRTRMFDALSLTFPCR